MNQGDVTFHGTFIKIVVYNPSTLDELKLWTIVLQNVMIPEANVVFGTMSKARTNNYFFF